MQRNVLRRLLPSAVSVVIIWCSVAVTAAEQVALTEESPDGRVFRVSAVLNVSGKVYPEAGPDKALNLAADAKFIYDERRLAGTGREAQTLRSVRHYDQAFATIHEQAVGAKAGVEQHSRPALREALRLVVATGQSDGVEVFSPSGPLTVAEVQLLKYPGDSLASLSLLPDSKARC